LNVQDTFVNFVGGVKVTETSINLVLILALIPSDKDKALSQGLIILMRCVYQPKFDRYLATKNE